MNGYRRPQRSEFEANEFEFEGEGEGEGESSGEFGNEMGFRRRRRRREGEMEFQSEYQGEGEYEAEADEAEAEAARAFLELQSEQELEQFLPLLLAPLLKGIAPMLMQVAGPLLGSIGSRVLGASNAPQQEQEQEGFLFGKLLGGLFGGRELEQEGEAEYWRYRRPYWRRPWGYNWSPPPVVAAPPPVVVEEPMGEMGEQEGFLGNILKGLIGEVESYDPPRRRLASARWFVRLARRAARHAAHAARAHAASGQPLTRQVVQDIVADAVTRAAHAGPRRTGGCGCSTRSASVANGGSGTWERRGNKIIIHL